MTQSKKQRYWQEHFSAWKASGLSQADYCKKHHLKPTTFAYWRHKQNQTQRKLVSLDLNPIRSSVNLTLPGGIQLEVSVGQLEQILPVIFRLVRA